MGKKLGKFQGPVNIEQSFCANKARNLINFYFLCNNHYCYHFAVAKNLLYSELEYFFVREQYLYFFVTYAFYLSTPKENLPMVSL